MALAAQLTALTACGEDGKNGVDGAPGEQGAAGESGKSCSAKPLADGSGYTLICGDKEIGVIKNGVDGVKGKDGADCKAKSMENGDYEISCGKTVVGVLFNGNGGSDEQGETGGTSCSAKALVGGSGYTLTCGGVDVGTISNGRDGYSCRADQNEDKTVTTITCETADGEVSYEVANGKDGVGCEVSRNGYELTITCANSEEVVDLRDFIVTSSSSETNSSSSVSPDEVPGTDPVPEVPAEIQISGYYSNSENCPADLTCRYATITAAYLNPTKTYGEILDTRDGQVYKTIEICDDKKENCQIWMAQNLNYRYVGVKFRAGTEYESDSTSWCYENKVSNCEVYGRLYTWAAAVDSVFISKNYDEECGFGKSCARFSASALATEPVRGACPLGWHLPSNEEWAVLYRNVGGYYRAPSLMANTGLWFYNRGEDAYDLGIDAYGFSILPAGRVYYGNFSQKEYAADFWSSSEDNNPSDFKPQNYAWRQEFRYGRSAMNQDHDSKTSGFSVRCLKN